VSLKIEGFDRLYFNGRVPALQTLGQIAGWLHWRGFPIASPAALGRNSQAFRAAVRRPSTPESAPDAPAPEPANTSEPTTADQAETGETTTRRPRRSPGLRVVSHRGVRAHARPAPPAND
jgi:hypothetical protein